MSPKYKSAITEPVFASYLDCTYKAFLRLRACKGEQTLLERHSVEFDTDYQTRAITQLLAAHAPEEINRQKNLNTGVDLAAGHILLADRVTVSDLEAGPTVLWNTATSTFVLRDHVVRTPLLNASLSLEIF